MIRIQEVLTSRESFSGLDLPNAEEVDVSVDLSLTTNQTNESKMLDKNRNHIES